VNKTVLAAERFERVGKRFGRRNGPLGHVALEILREFANVINFRTGRLEPSIAYLACKLRRSPSAIARALSRLRLRGFLDWIRRYETTGDEGRGQPPRQVSNAYRLVLPPVASRLGIDDAPLPDDVETVKADREAVIAEQERDQIKARMAELAEARDVMRKARQAALAAHADRAAVFRSMPDYSGEKIEISAALRRALK
jgi:hypothetical protein